MLLSNGWIESYNNLEFWWKINEKAKREGLSPHTWHLCAKDLPPRPSHWEELQNTMSTPLALIWQHSFHSFGFLLLDPCFLRDSRVYRVQCLPQGRACTYIQFQCTVFLPLVISYSSLETLDFLGQVDSIHLVITLDRAELWVSRVLSLYPVPLDMLWVCVSVHRWTLLLIKWPFQRICLLQLLP